MDVLSNEKSYFDDLPNEILLHILNLRCYVKFKIGDSFCSYVKNMYCYMLRRICKRFRDIITNQVTISFLRVKAIVGLNGQTHLCTVFKRIDNIRIYYTKEPIESFLPLIDYIDRSTIISNTKDVIEYDDANMLEYYWRRRHEIKHLKITFSEHSVIVNGPRGLFLLERSKEWLISKGINRITYKSLN